jgi:hypothetical protein
LGFTGGAGGAGQGGGLFTSGGTLSFTNDTFRADTATGGTGGNGGTGGSRSTTGTGGSGGAGQGGGFVAQAPTSVTQSSVTLTLDQATGGSGGSGRPRGSRGTESNKNFLIIP